MKQPYDYDLIVIGGGIAGMVSAVTANGLGKHVAVIEKSKLGGNCTNSTCIPSKALIRLSQVSRDLAHLHRLGLLVHPASGLSSRMVMPHIRGIVQKAYEKDAPETFAGIGVDVIQGSASFIDGNRIQVNGQIFSAAKFIIATGTSPFIPPIDGLGDVNFLTNETLYQLDEVPKSIIILGGGVDGLEYASAFGLLGVETTVIEMATRLLPMVDLELVNHLLRTLRGEGIRLLTGTKATRIYNREDKVMLRVEQGDGSYEEIIADRVIVAVGRKPDLEELSLEKAGVDYNARGIITDSRLRTSAPDIYACGDIAGPYQLASTAEAQAIIATTNAVLPIKRSVDYGNNVYVVFTEPPLAYLGLTEMQAYEMFGDKLKVYRFDYTNMRRALVDGKNVGMAKLLCDGGGRIVGAHILGEGAGEVIHEIQAIKAFKKPLHKLNAVTHAYPTYAQALVGRASQLAFLDRMGGNIFVRIALWLLPGYANRLHVARERLAEISPVGSFAKTEKPDDFYSVAAKPSSEIQVNGALNLDNTFAIKSRVANQESIIVDIRGSLDRACEKALSRACGDAIEKSKNILFNLSGLVHMDTEGAGLLVICASLAAQKNLGVGVMGLRDDFKDLFHLTRLDEAIVLFDDEREALGCHSLLEKRHSQTGTRSIYKGPPVDGWARSIDYVSIRDIPGEAMNINVHGRRVTSPVKGFGRLWNKKYRLRLYDSDMDPRRIVSLWKSAFPEFWPKGNRVFSSEKAPIAPGTLAVLNLSLPGGLTLAAGIMVVYVDETSFTFMTIEGHMLSGLINFSSFHEDAATIIQVHALFRANDPLMELAFRLGASKQEDQFWHETLNNLARRLGSHGNVEQHFTLIDGRIDWSEKKNLWKNAAIRSSLYMPLYMLKKIIHLKR
jgi:anti-anti-sigma factor